MNRFTLIVGATLATCALATGAMAYTESDDEKHEIQIKCWHPDLSDKTETGNTITVEFWKNDKMIESTSRNQQIASGGVSWGATMAATGSVEESKWRTGAPQCGKTSARYEFSGIPDGGDHEINPTYFIIRTDGGNALFMDAVYYIDHENEKRNWQWGNFGGSGFCLSTDDDDATRGWKKYVDGCHTALKFVLKKNKAKIVD